MPHPSRSRPQSALAPCGRRSVGGAAAGSQGVGGKASPIGDMAGRPAAPSSSVATIEAFSHRTFLLVGRPRTNRLALGPPPSPTIQRSGVLQVNIGRLTDALRPLRCSVW